MSDGESRAMTRDGQEPNSVGKGGGSEGLWSSRMSPEGRAAMMLCCWVKFSGRKCWKQRSWSWVIGVRRYMNLEYAVLLLALLKSSSGPDFKVRFRPSRGYEMSRCPVWARWILKHCSVESADSAGRPWPCLVASFAPGISLQ
jgi:hypothetical protein